MERKEAVFLNSVFFVIGFIIVFSVAGFALQELVSGTAHMLMNYFRLIGGAIIIAFGCAMLLSTRYFIPIFTQEYKPRISTKAFGNGYIASLVFGIGFAIGWTPCVGPILGSIYALAITTPGLGFLLLVAYSFGLGIPFLVAGFFVSEFTSFTKKLGPFLRYFNIISGLLLIALGVLVITNYIGIISVFLIGNGGSVSLSGQLDFAIAILAGILTFLSPCILPLVPAYIAYIGGTATKASL